MANVMDKKSLTRGAFAAVLAAAIVSLFAAPLISDDRRSATEAIDADRALQILVDGNRRFVEGHRVSRDEPRRRAELSQTQKPIAVVVSCSDSRVPPEIVFDQSLGDLFDVRTAGHVVGDLELGSIEYAAEHLGTPLIVVLGHKRCGAVTAAVSAAGGAGGEAKGGGGGDAAPEGHIGAVVKAIQPAVLEVKSRPGDLVDNAIYANVRDTVRRLSSTEPILSHLVHEGKLKIVGGRYDLDSGQVEILPAAEH